MAECCCFFSYFFSFSSQHFGIITSLFRFPIKASVSPALHAGLFLFFFFFVIPLRHRVRATRGRWQRLFCFANERMINCRLCLTGGDGPDDDARHLMRMRMPHTNTRAHIHCTAFQIHLLPKMH